MTNDQTASILRAIALLSDIIREPRPEAQAASSLLLWQLANEWEAE